MQLYSESLTSYKRLKTKEVKIGNLLLGNGNPIRIQTMTTTDTMDTIGTVEQTIRCIEAGAELVRITAPSKKEAENLKNIKDELNRRGYYVPLIADIHFTPNAAEIAARIIEKVRVNPGNYVDKKKFEQIEYTDAEYLEEIDRIQERFTPLVKICKEYGTAMRIGTNHGSLSDRIMSRYGDTPIGMVESAMEFLRIARYESYHNIILSMKASNPQVMVQAYRLLISKMDEEFGECYPLHLGVTEAGDGEDGRIKSAIGIGTLLEDGIGDTIRVSLTEDPEFEIPVCRDIVKRYQAPPPPIGGIKGSALSEDDAASGAESTASQAKDYGSYYKTSDPAMYQLLKDFVKTHRGQPTEAENVLWQNLRGKKLDNYKFRRQHVIGTFIADFICLSHNLIIEVDGLIHQLPENQISDAERTNWLKTNGFEVIRFTNNQVLSNIDTVLNKILQKLRLRKSSKEQPTSGLPLIPPMGGGGASPFEYKRRNTFAVDNIGIGHVPVVIADLSKIESITPQTLESVGYKYDAATDKWSIGDMAADYIYTNKPELAFALPGTLKVITSPSHWTTAAEQSKYFPIYDLDEYHTASQKHGFANFVMVGCNGEIPDLDLEEKLQALGEDRTVVLCLSSTNKNAMQSVRRMFTELAKHYIKNPAIIVVDSNWQTPDEHLIHYGTEAGALLLDGFGDGLCLGMTSASHGLQGVGESNASGRNYLDNRTVEQFINNTAFGILQATRTRISKTEYISCPSCGRTLFELQETTARIRARTNHLKGVKIAIMGCIVNGPGEMADADFGYVGSGVGKITLYKGKEVVKRNVNSDVAVDELINLLKENEAWIDAPAI